MEFKNMAMADILTGLKSGEYDNLDEVGMNDLVRAMAKAQGVETDAKKAKLEQQRNDFSDAIQGMVKPESLDISFSKEGKVKVSFYIERVEGKNKLTDYHQGGSSATPSVSPFKGCTFRIDQQDSIIFSEANGSHLNWELTDGDVYALNSCKRVWIYFGGKVRTAALNDDGKKMSEGTATGLLEKLTDEQRARVEVMKDGEAIALDDFLASLS